MKAEVKLTKEELAVNQRICDGLLKQYGAGLLTKDEFWTLLEEKIK